MKSVQEKAQRGGLEGVKGEREGGREGGMESRGGGRAVGVGVRVGGVVGREDDEKKT